MPRELPNELFSIVLAYGSFNQFLEQQILQDIEAGALNSDDMVDDVAALRGWEHDGTWERAVAG